MNGELGSNLSGSVLLEELDLESDIVEAANVLFRVHRNLDFLIIRKLSAHSLQHTASQLMSLHPFKRPDR